jgi:hypothetical protein
LLFDLGEACTAAHAVMMPPFTKDGNAQSGFAQHLNCRI